MDKLELKALGKINLGLDVLGQGGRMVTRCAHVMQTLYLYDNVTAAKEVGPRYRDRFRSFLSAE